MSWRSIEAETPALPQEPALARILQGYSIEVTGHDVDAAIDQASPGTEVFVANLPRDADDVLVACARRLGRAGLVAVPHIAARKIRDLGHLDGLIARLAGEAGVERVLALGGDRDEPAGDFRESLQLVRSGVFERHGIRQVSIAAYPEGHPRIDGAALRQAMKSKLAALAEAGTEARLVSQFAFAPAPILEFIRQMRADGIRAPLRVGVAGPASRAKLVKYALRCGVGASLRVLTGNRRLASGLLGAETPAAVLETVAAAAHEDPSLRIEGTHFFTFGAPEASIGWARAQSG